MDYNIKVGIIGAAGYTGGELIRLLLHHPSVILSGIQSNSQAGKKISAVHQDLEGDTELTFSENIDMDLDVLFFCTGHGESTTLLPKLHVLPSTKVIDLSNDFRLKAHNTSGERTFVYGLPEINRAAIKTAVSVANPGCFATAIQLAILPLLASGHMSDMYITGITGSTGAGQSLSNTSHFSWRTNNIQAYKTLSHQHLDEIRESSEVVSPNNIAAPIHFVPWRGDFARGIFVSAQTKCTLSEIEVAALYNQFYADAAFTFVTKQQVHLKQILNTNKCLIQIEKSGDQLVIHAVIDNLLKGASGQAVQNMNIMFGLPEQTGLTLKASAF